MGDVWGVWFKNIYERSMRSWQAVVDFQLLDLKVSFYNVRLILKKYEIQYEACIYRWIVLQKILHFIALWENELLEFCSVKPHTLCLFLGLESLSIAGLLIQHRTCHSYYSLPSLFYVTSLKTSGIIIIVMKLLTTWQRHVKLSL